MFMYLRERERETSMWERNIVWLPPVPTPTGDRTCNLGLCTDLKLNPQHVGVWDDAPTNWATWPGTVNAIKKLT